MPLHESDQQLFTEAEVQIARRAALFNATAAVIDHEPRSDDRKVNVGGTATAGYGVSYDGTEGAENTPVEVMIPSSDFINRPA